MSDDKKINGSEGACAMQSISAILLQVPRFAVEENSPVRPSVRKLGFTPLAPEMTMESKRDQDDGGRLVVGNDYMRIVKRKSEIERR